LPFLPPELEQYRHRVQILRKFTYDSVHKKCTKNAYKTVLQGSGRMRSGAQEINKKVTKCHVFSSGANTYFRGEDGLKCGIVGGK
jgi:hypothetical protein